MAIEFDLPNAAAIETLVVRSLEPHFHEADKWSKILSLALKGRSHNDIECAIIHARRAAVTSNQSLADQLRPLVADIDTLDRKERIELAKRLQTSGVTSQREAQRITGVARETIRKPLAERQRRRRKVPA